MKKLVCFLTAAMIGTVAGAAAVLPSCSLFTGDTVTDLLNQSCIVGDKIFLNFTSSSPKNVTDEVTFAPLAPVNNDPGVAFNGLTAAAGQTVAFNIGYSVQVLPKSPFLIQAGDLSISDVAFGTGASLAGSEKYCIAGHGNAETCIADGGQLYSGGISASAASAALSSETTLPHVTTLDVSTDLTITAGSATTKVGSIQQRAAQVSVPEPATLLLLGSGLIAIRAFSRRQVERNA